MKRLATFILFFALLSTVVAQKVDEKSSDESKNKISSVDGTNGTQANGDYITFYDGTKPLMHFVSYGTGGFINLMPVQTINDVYFESLGNVDGDLYWGPLKVSTSASGINDLSDGVFDMTSRNLFLGDASQPISGYANIGIGDQFTFNNLSTGYENTIIGMEAFTSNTTGEWNIGIGNNVLRLNTEGSLNAAVGTLALSSNTTGDSNVGFGADALGGNTTGSSNVGIGQAANVLNQEGSFNTIIGMEAGFGTANHNKSGNIFLGYQAGYNEMDNNKLYIENSNSTTPLIYGEFDNDLVKINGDFHVTGNITADGSTPGSGDNDWTISGNNIINANTGNVGIGIPTPLAKLHINGGTSGNALVVANQSGLNRLIVSDDGHVGINHLYTTVTSNVRGILGDSYYFTVEGPGISEYIFDIFGTGDAQFYNNLTIDGNLTVNGTTNSPAPSVTIDHPLDPENKILTHSSIESPDMMNIYNGNVSLDGNGEAIVTMADWFEALNKDFRYQLTAIGAPGPNLYIAEKINGNKFRISGGSAGMEVSWQVTGVRQDAYANENRIEVEELKKPEERGKYLHPTAFGQPKEMGISFSEKLKREEQRVEN